MNTNMHRQVNPITLPRMLGDMAVEINNLFMGSNILHHTPTEENQLGQSGIHTVLEDLHDVIDAHKDQPSSVLHRALHSFLTKGIKVFPK